MFTPTHSPTNSNHLFRRSRQVDDAGMEYGFNADDLARAVEVWFHASGASYETTIGEAAKVFSVTPEFLAEVIDRQENPYFFAAQADDPAARILDCDGE